MHIKEKALRGEKVFGTMLRTVRNPAICLLAKQAGLDFVMFDCESPNYNIQTLHDLCLMANAAGLPPLARASMLDKDWISRTLDCGAEGVMAPMVETAGMAAELVKWSKYPPVGSRGFAPGGAAVRYARGAKHADAMRDGNASVLTIAQIETAEAIQNIDAIAGTPGVDVLLIGPNDLSISLGVPGDVSGPVMEEAIGKVAAACRSAGKVFGMHAGPALLSRWAADLGFLMTGSDTDMLATGLEGAMAAMRKAVGEK
ncbi:MAG TPA: aldolase/citrate lyase family protein [Candidatus Limnocylindria bacterium]|nr:aldolase/citrate lyase family protein [Candidatus Limnocylindria bacterium]